MKFVKLFEGMKYIYSSKHNMVMGEWEANKYIEFKINEEHNERVIKETLYYEKRKIL